ncbi:MAG: hypothetical protein JWL97_4419, partial [Gemmatimonadales bacterium]|nr:hypothetical protein [Gemmatimonadales bacterium]
MYMILLPRVIEREEERLADHKG